MTRSMLDVLKPICEVVQLILTRIDGAPLDDRWHEQLPKLRRAVEQSMNDTKSTNKFDNEVNKK